MFCIKCGQEIDENFSFCTRCGAQIEKKSPIKMVCPFCERTFEENIFFCDTCGTRLAKGTDYSALKNNIDEKNIVTYPEKNGHETTFPVGNLVSGGTPSTEYGYTGGMNVANRPLGARVHQTGLVYYVKTMFLLEPTGKITIYDNGLTFEVSMLGSAKHNHVIYFDDIYEIQRSTYLGTPWALKIIKKTGEKFDYNMGVINKSSMDTIIQVFELYKSERR